MNTTPTTNQIANASPELVRRASVPSNDDAGKNREFVLRSERMGLGNAQ